MGYFDTVLKEYGESLGFSDMTRRADGLCSFYYKNTNLTISMQTDQKEERVVLLSQIGGVDPDDLDERIIDLLKANYFWSETNGATLSIDPEGGGVFVAMQLLVHMLDAESFSKVIDSFQEVALNWAQKIAANNRIE